MAVRGRAGSKTTRFRPATRPYWRASSSRWVIRSCSAARFEGGSSTGGSNPARGGSSGSPARAAAASMVALASAMSATIFSPAHSPLWRDRATACRPKETSSATEPGASTGHHQAAAHGLAGAGDGGGLGGGVVADQRHRAAQRGRAGEVAVADGVGRAVQARALAVPEAGDPVVAAALQLTQQLRAGHGGGGQLLVQARLEDDAGGPGVLGRRGPAPCPGRRAASPGSR